MQTELQLVSLEQAKKLKELGFNWEMAYSYYLLFDNTAILEHIPCTKGYIDYYYAPSIALALKWFRDVKNIHYHIEPKGFYIKYLIHYQAFSITESNCKECLPHNTYREKKPKPPFSILTTIKDLPKYDKCYVCKTDDNNKVYNLKLFNTYEAAESALLDALIKYVEGVK